MKIPRPEIEDLIPGQCTFIEDPNPNKSNMLTLVKKRVSDFSIVTGRLFAVRCYGFAYCVRRLK